MDRLMRAICWLTTRHRQRVLVVRDGHLKGICIGCEKVMLDLGPADGKVTIP